MYYIIEGELSEATEKTFGAKAPDAQARRRHWLAHTTRVMQMFYSFTNEAFILKRFTGSPAVILTSLDRCGAQPAMDLTTYGGQSAVGGHIRQALLSAHVILPRDAVDNVFGAAERSACL